MTLASSAVGGLTLADTDGTLGGVNRSFAGEILSGLIVLNLLGGETSWSSVFSLGS